MDDTSVLQTNQALGKGGNVVFMGDEYDRNALLLVELLENSHNVAAGLGIEITGRFVRKYKLRIIYQSPANGDALLLSS